MKPKK